MTITAHTHIYIYILFFLRCKTAIHLDKTGVYITLAI